jgi:hypothetical protein
MKTSGKIIALLLITGSHPSFSQPNDETSGNKFVVRKQALGDFAFELTKMNVLYIGVDNPMQIVTRRNLKNFSLELSGGTLTATNDGYIARVTTPGSAELTVKDGTNVIASKTYRVKRVPDPVAMLAGSKGGPIAKEILAASPGIVVSMENFDFELFFIITSFRMTLVCRGRDPIEIGSESNLLTATMKQLILSAPAGSKIYFEYIRARLPDSTTRSLAPLNFVIL